MAAAAARRVFSGHVWKLAGLRQGAKALIDRFAGGAIKEDPAGGKSRGQSPDGWGVGGWDTPPGTLAHRTLCKPFCSGTCALFCFRGTSTRRLLSRIDHTLITVGTDLLIHRYQCNGAARAANRKSHKPPPDGTSL